MARAIVRPAARRDLIRHFVYIGENSGVATARRFRAAARLTFSELAQTPRMGAPRKLGKFPDLRMWRVREFEKYLIFYQPITDGVSIERVIHAAQDYNRLLGSAS
ncbi:MAG: type II toxin-antitoxin system RelE/ParE family toxin [Terriglobia bacterium]